jgi:predicted dehydrogenase
MHSRRKFIGQVASGIAGTLATSNVLEANDRIRVGLIGAGDRGLQLVREAAACLNTEVVAFADVYTRRLEEAAKATPAAKTYLDYKYLLDDKSVDAVLIATPQHLHAEHFIASLTRGAGVSGKTMAFTVSMLGACGRLTKRQASTVQIGHQYAIGPRGRCRRASGGKVGKVTAFTPHVPQYADEAAVVGAGVSGHDPGKHPLEEFPG